MAPAINRVMGRTEWLLLLALAAVWSGAFFFTKIALSGLPPFSIVLCRVGLAAAALVVFARLSGLDIPRDIRTWAAFFVMGALNNVIPFSLIVWGQTQIASALAAILNAATPLSTVVLAHALTRDERLTMTRGAGVIVGFAGVTLMIGLDALSGLGRDVAAQLACVAATVSYALAGIYGRRFRGLPPAITAAGQVTASTCMILPLALVIDQPWTLARPGFETLAAIAGLALICTAFAYVLYFRILATAGATNLLLVTFLIPVGALMLGATFLGERLDPRHFAGMALIAAGLAAIDGRVFAVLKRRLARGGA